MAGSVIVRGKTTINEQGFIHHDDKPMAWDEADKRAGYRLDRRKSYAFVDGDLCELCTYSTRCSGCSDDDPYAQRGGGCDECGYQGRVRNAMWVPALTPSPPPTQENAG